MLGLLVFWGQSLGLDFGVWLCFAEGEAPQSPPPAGTPPAYSAAEPFTYLGHSASLGVRG